MARSRKPARRLSLECLESREVPTINLVADINPTGDSSPTFPNSGFQGYDQQTVVNGVAYFVADDGTHGTELWQSDGTANGTKMVADLSPGTQGTFIQELTVAGDSTLVFAASASTGVTGPRLYKLDAAGIALLVDDTYNIGGGEASLVDNLLVVGDSVYYSNPFQPEGKQFVQEAVYKADLSGSFARLTPAAAPDLRAIGPFIQAGGAAYFIGSNQADTTATGLWTTDGTSAGTKLLAPESTASLLGAVGENVYFRTTPDGLSTVLRVYNTATEMTETIQTFPSNNVIAEAVPVGDRLYFSVLGAAGLAADQLWTSDGTADGTVPVRDFGTPNNFGISLVGRGGDRLSFVANDGEHGFELWQSDGTNAGTRMVRDINSGPAGALESYNAFSSGIIPTVGGRTYFVADDGVNGVQLWTTDGTEANTVPLGKTSDPSGLVQNFFIGAIGDDILLSAFDGRGRELWRTGGESSAPAATDVALVATPSVADGGLNVVLTATVSSAGGTPTGTVTFTTTIGNPQTRPVVNGVATLTSFLSFTDILAGNIPSVTAAYTPNTTAFLADTSEQVRVDLPPGLLTLSVTSPATVQTVQQIALTATLSIPIIPAGIPFPGLVMFDLVSSTGSVTPLGTSVIPTGFVTLPALITDPPGDYLVRVTYSVVDGVVLATATTPITVTAVPPTPTAADTQTALVAAPSVGVGGLDITLTATVTATTGRPVGTVAFTASNGATITPDNLGFVSDGVARATTFLSLTDILAGNIPTVTATFNPGNGEYLTSTSTGVRVDLPPGLVLVTFTDSIPDTAAGGRLRATVAVGIPLAPAGFPIPGAVSFTALSASGQEFPLGLVPLVNGRASLDTMANLPAGRYAILARFVVGTGIELGGANNTVLVTGGTTLPSTSRTALLGSPTIGLVSNGRFRLVKPDGSEAPGGSNVGNQFAEVAVGDFNGDGTIDAALGTGPGARAQVQTRNGASGAVMLDMAPFEDFTGGVFLAVADINGDGTPDLAISPDKGGGPRVTILDGKTSQKVIDFFGIDDPNFRGGARTSFGDVNGDGVADLIVAAGIDGGPRVAVYDGQSLGTGRPVKLFNDFFAFEQTLRNGVFIAAGDIDGDGRADIVAGGGPGGSPRVFGISGKDLLASGGGTLTQVCNFFAGDESSRLGVRVTVKDRDGDGRGDLVTAAVGGSSTTVYLGLGIAPSGTPAGFDLPGEFLGGVQVG